MIGKKILPGKNPSEKKSSKRTCLTLFFGFLLGLLIIILLLAAGVVAALSATGIVEVPILSNLFKPPEVTEDFSFEEVNSQSLEKKISKLEGAKGKVDVTFTDDEVNTMLSSFSSSSSSEGPPLQDVRIKFEKGKIKLTGKIPPAGSPVYFVGSLSIKNGALDIGVETLKMGALPIPGAVAEKLLETALSELGFSSDQIPIEELNLLDGKIEIKGFDPSSFGSLGGESGGEKER
ncbi:MAG: hypothetical protein BMS9Abin34_056 [Patescibacteria group bacterium]|nr:MAG: hypothetical protein BMS9Abin34_056 [Patescibacteria group bacterium]